MMNFPRKQIVIIGGGAGGLELVVRLCRVAKKYSLDVILVDRQLKHLWKPLLHEVAAGTFNSYQDEIDYISYAYQHGFQYHYATLEEINHKEKWINIYPCQLDGENHVKTTKINYDLLILATGSQVNDFNIPGVREHCLLLDDLAQAELFHQVIMQEVIKKNQLHPAQDHKIQINIIGGGATGAELAAELNFALTHTFKYLGKGVKSKDDSPFQITVIDSAPRLLSMLPERVSRQATEYLLKNNINIILGTQINEVTNKGLKTSTQQFIDSSITVWAAGVKANNYKVKHDLEMNKLYQFCVNQHLQTTRDPNVFAFGDCASCPQTDQEGNAYNVPPRAQAAHQQAILLSQSIPRLLQGKPILPFIYKDYGSLISLSPHNAVGVIMSRLTQNFFLKGLFARFTYWSLYKKHLLLIKGTKYVFLSTVIDFLMKKQRPEIKLH
ncbi:MAG: NAD(P)/FAD-dependent oxidoreductase [Legionella sp.]|nr:NAD(P)/FAD-dependent oxidoreductase [Legionella sp.]